MPKTHAPRPTDASSAIRRAAPLMAGTLLAVPALLPLVVGFLPQLYFDRDPRAGFDAGSYTAFGPAGAAVWHVLSVFAAGIALAVYLWLGGRIRWWAIGLAGIGCAAAAWHAGHHADNAILCGAWIAGAALAVAAAHVGADHMARRWMAALLVAIMVPVGLQASYDVLIQKPRDIAFWEANQAELLAGQGVAPGSPQHELLDRRARSNDATGPFAFSNPLGTLAGGGALLALCIAGGLMLPARQYRGPAIVAPMAAGLLALAAVWFSHSTGAQAAVVLALGLVGVSARLARTHMRRAVPVLALLLVALPIIAVLVRGAAGPPDSMSGERSILFRFHYWQAAERIFTAAEAPGNWLVGVGPEGYPTGYLIHKNPLNPENVYSAHGVFVDWLTMLGLGGAAFALLTLGWLWLAGRYAARQPTDEDESDTAPTKQTGDTAPTPLLHRPAVVTSLVAAAVLFGTQYAVQLPMMGIELTLLWLAGTIGFIAVASVIGEQRTLPDRWLRLGLLGMAAVVLIHSQIEMTLSLMGTAIPAWFLLGLAGAQDNTREQAQRTSPRIAATVAAVTVLASTLFAVSYAAPVVSHQQHLVDASERFAVGDPYRAIAALEKAHAVLPTEGTPARWIAIARRDEMAALAAQGNHEAAREALGLALAATDRHLEADPDAADMYRLRAGILLEAAELLRDDALREQAAEERRWLTTKSPYNLADAVTLGDLLWDLGRRDEALYNYRRALAIDADLYLDTATQLDTSERERVKARVEMHDANNITP